MTISVILVVPHMPRLCIQQVEDKRDQVLRQWAVGQYAGHGMVCDHF